MFGQPFRRIYPLLPNTPTSFPTLPCPPKPWFLPSFGSHREIGFPAPERTFPGAKEPASPRRRKSSGKAAAPRMGKCHEASVQAVPSGLGDRSPWSPLCRCQCPRGPAAATGSASQSPRQELSPEQARGWSLEAGHRPHPGAPGGCGGAAHPREPSAPVSGEASVFPTPVARGAREQPPDAPRLLAGG